ncbi:hypothetical protein PHLGIDRAFT_468415 [Phlebiopsis gigantea 11061_1 CR5-6]|uniref:Uncharacterized protein n=1 Tax=Phlebiopsis gigantea (strain 11061_1 CR5-6) TaxID=745531 RepID=A0A0C3PJB8_PHLG1|nr:hypothetical protein PHLGIDRAFT_468415 [Phlebiopsis gigantea 11061_1 CR5-6]
MSSSACLITAYDTVTLGSTHWTVTRRRHSFHSSAQGDSLGTAKSRLRLQPGHVYAIDHFRVSERRETLRSDGQEADDCTARGQSGEQWQCSFPRPSRTISCALLSADCIIVNIAVPGEKDHSVDMLLYTSAIREDSVYADLSQPLSLALAAFPLLSKPLQMDAV